MNFPIDPQAMIQLILQRRLRGTEILRSIPLSKCPSLEQGVGELNQDLTRIFYQLFSKDETSRELKMVEILPFNERKTPMPVCNKLFNLNDYMFRCYDCTIHEAAVLCVDCFENGDHKGHRFTKFTSGGGNCDCGNPDAVSPSGFCKNHRGKPEDITIQQREMNQFCTIIRQIFMWALMLHQLKLKLECHMMMAHLIAALSHLNNQSLFYNIMTDHLLFEGDNPLISHILTIGSQSSESILGKYATELFLNMFSHEQFKEKLAAAFINAYNKLYRFESSKFQSLFIQIFANNDLVEKVIGKTRMSLDPRGRVYDSYTYYNNLIFMGSIRERSARIFFTPIIEGGGIHCQLFEQMITQCENGARRPEQVYGGRINQYHLFYVANKIMIKLIKNQPELLWLQIANNWKKLQQTQFKKNKIMIIPHRLLVILFFTYYQGDFRKIDIEEIKKRMNKSDKDIKDLLKKLTLGFMGCLKEMGYFLSSNDFGGCSFQYYIDIYCRSTVGSKIILLDMLGLKFCAMAYSRFAQVSFDRHILSNFQAELRKQVGYNSNSNADWRQPEQEEQQEQPNSNKIKSKSRSVFFYMGWMNTLYLIMQAIIVDRAQVYLANELQMTDIPLLKEMQLNQMKKLMLNVRQASMHDIQSIGYFWFSKLIDKNLLAQVANYDKNKKKYVIKPEITGGPIKLEFLKSFVKAPDHFMKRIDANSLEVNEETRMWRDLMFPPKMLEDIYMGLYEHLKGGLIKDYSKYLKEIALHLRAMNLLFENGSQALTTAIKQAKKLAQNSNEQTQKEIMSMFQSDNRSKSIERQMGKQQQSKRLQLLRKKKQQKKKAIKQKSQINKYINPFPERQAILQQQTCIICHEDSVSSPTFYLSSIFLSNIMFSTLKIQGQNPYFTTCFHVIHEKCYTEFFKKQETSCPFCTAFTNILLPTEKFLDHRETIELCVQKMLKVVNKLHGRQIGNICLEMVKSVVQFYFSGMVDQSLINQKQIKLFTIVVKIIASSYNLCTNEDKSIFFAQLFQFSSKFDQQSTVDYNIGLLMKLIFSILQQYFDKQQLSQSFLKQLLSSSKFLPKHDIQKLLYLSAKLFNCLINQQEILEFYIEAEVPELKGYIHSYDPPKTIKALLQQRSLVYSEGICKTGHNICLCLICCWKGCYDCKACTTHATQLHNRQTLFFNYTTGGLYYYFNNSIILLRPLYVNDLGLPWQPKFQQSSYFFEIDVYNKMIQALRGGYLIHLVRANYQNLRITQSTYRTY